MPHDESHRAASLDYLRALLEVGHAVRAGSALESVLADIARALSSAMRFGTVIIDLYRPAWDDFEVVVVHGREEVRRLLMGSTSDWYDWTTALDDRYERHGAYLIPHGRVRVPPHVPKGGDPADPNAWQADDALMLPLRASDDRLLGVVSVDDPADGRRPSDEQLEVLVAVAEQAAVAIEHAQAEVDARRHRAALEHLLVVSGQLNGQRSIEEVLDTICAGIRDALGFQKVGVFLADRPEGVLEPRASVGWTPEEVASMPRAPLASVRDLMDPALEREGCLLMPESEAEARVPKSLHGRYHAAPPRGRGPLAWGTNRLFVALRNRDGELNGVLWADDPVDGLLPTAERLKALRTFANQAMSVIESARQLEHVSHLAAHDPLTGLRNRRDLEPRIDASLSGPAGAGELALLVCDLDHFKRVNDSLGHQGGDSVLRRFAAVLKVCTRGTDMPTRLGGEEFAVVLTGVDGEVALTVAERIRLAARSEFDHDPVPVSVSIGVAAAGDELRTADDLMRAANRALYAAKRLGRDRCLLYQHDTIDLLDGLQNAGAATQEQLEAAILLAETLDLRDGGTARHSQTVGQIAEQIACELGWPAVKVERMRVAGLLHDIGKLGIADAILHKPDALDAREWEEIKRHPEIGARILDHANLRDVAGWVLRHHERLDGRGYPSGLRGDRIPVESRVLAVADAYEAMTADRPYRRALGQEVAEAELREGAGSQFDPVVVDAMLTVLGRGSLTPVEPSPLADPIPPAA